MQVVKDPVANSQLILSESLAMLDIASMLDKCTLPVVELMKQSQVRKSPPVLISEAGKVLKEHDVESFEAEFPTLAAACRDGKLGEFSYRIQDAMYQIGEVILAVRKAKYMVVKDDQRKELNLRAKAAIGDIVAYLVNTFSMWDSENVCMAVSSVCERQGTSQDVLYGELLSAMDEAGCSYRAYEPMSPVYTELMAADSVFMAECSEKDLALTDEQALAVIRGEVSSAEVIDQLSRERVVTPFSASENVTPFTLMSRLNLEF